MTTELYLDGNATSAVLPAAIAAAAHAMGQGFGNPSSSHATGLQARAMLDGVRARARALLGAGAGRLMFNSGATEGIQTAILSALCALREQREHSATAPRWLVYGATEHKAVPEALAHWNRLLGLDLELVKLPVDGDGRHDLERLRVLAPGAGLVCTMAANNETGVLSDLAGIEAVLTGSGSGALWLVDCVQALGKLDLDLAATRIDYAPFSGHKLYAPKGIGMLYVRAGAPFTPLMMGGGQESGLRSGTENMAGIAALGAVLAALDDGATFRDHATLFGYRERLAASLRAALPGIVFNAPFAASLPTTLNFSVPGFSSKELLDLFDAAGMRVSAGSACSAAKAAPSHVLEAMGLPDWCSGAAVRLSYGPVVDAATVDAACARIARCGAALRASCLIPPDGGAEAGHADGAPRASLPADGLVQLVADGACCWLLTDAASRACVVIDPQATLVDRLVTSIGCQDLQVRAILHTALPADAGAARFALLQALGARAERAASRDPLGWPASRASVTLDDGRPAAALLLGARTLARVPQGPERSVYLLGGADGIAAGQPRFAFTGALDTHDPAALGAAHIGPDTLLCAGRDEQGRVCTTPRSEAAAAVATAAAGAAAVATAAAAAGVSDPWLLPAAGLAHFLRSHPDAVLVDVREAWEHAAAGPASVLAGKAARSVPLSHLAAHLEHWLAGTPAPLVFFCRTGNRSGKAVACLRRLGHPGAWHLGGGVALGGAAFAPLALAA